MSSCHDHADNCCVGWCKTCQYHAAIEPHEQAVIKAAEACVHGYRDQMPDGGGINIGPFDPELCKDLHDRVVALQEVRDA